MSTGINYFEGLSNSKNILSDLKGLIMTAYASGTNAWTVLGETKDAQLRTTILYLKGTADNGTPLYLMLDNTLMNMKSIKLQSAEEMIAGSPVTMTNPTVQADYHYVKVSSSAPRDLLTPINYWISITNNRIAMVIQGDPTIDFVGYIKNLMYFGVIKAMNATDLADVCLTFGSDVSPSPSTLYGTYTSDAVNTFAMLRTNSGVLWQKHYATFITQQQTLALEATGFNASKWTGKYHMSPIYIVHPYDGYRGTLDGVIAVDKNNILHLDELLVDTDTVEIKDRYKYFDCNSSFDFLMTSPHTNEGLALLKAPGVTG